MDKEKEKLIKFVIRNVLSIEEKALIYDPTPNSRS